MLFRSDCGPTTCGASTCSPTATTMAGWSQATQDAARMRSGPRTMSCSGCGRPAQPSTPQCTSRYNSIYPASVCWFWRRIFTTVTRTVILGVNPTHPVFWRLGTLSRTTSSHVVVSCLYLGQASLGDSPSAALLVRNRVHEALRVSALPKHHATAPVFVYTRPVFIDRNRRFLSQVRNKEIQVRLARRPLPERSPPEFQGVWF